MEIEREREALELLREASRICRKLIGTEVDQGRMEKLCAVIDEIEEAIRIVEAGRSP